MFKLVAIVLSFFLMSLPAFAQLTTNECPVPIHTGEFPGKQVTGVDIVSQTNGISMLTYSPSQGALGTAKVSLPDCKGTFLLTMPQLKPIPMRSLSSEVWMAEGFPQYKGIVNFAGISQVAITATVQDPATMLISVRGDVDAKVSSGARIKGSWDTDALASYSGDASERPECLCRDELDAYIKDRIQDLTRHEALLRKKSIRKRPAGMVPDLSAPASSFWTGPIYEEVINLMHFDKMSYKDAVAGAIQEADDITNQRIPMGSSGSHRHGGQSSSAIAAQTDPIECTTVYGNEHLDTCFPFISLESTEIHENVHVAACQARNTVSRAAGEKKGSRYDETDIDGYANEEADSYAAEIAYLKGWIKNNCD